MTPEDETVRGVVQPYCLKSEQVRSSLKKFPEFAGIIYGNSMV